MPIIFSMELIPAPIGSTLQTKHALLIAVALESKCDSCEELSKKSWCFSIISVSKCVIQWSVVLIRRSNNFVPSWYARKHSIAQLEIPWVFLSLVGRMCTRFGLGATLPWNVSRMWVCWDNLLSILVQTRPYMSFHTSPHSPWDLNIKPGTGEIFFINAWFLPILAVLSAMSMWYTCDIHQFSGLAVPSPNYF